MVPSQRMSALIVTSWSKHWLCRKFLFEKLAVSGFQWTWFHFKTTWLKGFWLHIDFCVRQPLLCIQRSYNGPILPWQAQTVQTQTMSIQSTAQLPFSMLCLRGNRDIALLLLGRGAVKGSLPPARRYKLLYSTRSRHCRSMLLLWQ